jgi:hypothetical protein
MGNLQLSHCFIFFINYKNYMIFIMCKTNFFSIIIDNYSNFFANFFFNFKYIVHFPFIPSLIVINFIIRFLSANLFMNFFNE